MPPRKKRAIAVDSTEVESTRKKPCRTISKSGSAPANEPTFCVMTCTTWFNEYKTESDGSIGPDGIVRFCKDLGMAPENVVMLVVAYRMEAKHMGFFTLAEWLKGMTYLQCDTIEKLRSKLGLLADSLSDPPTFKNVFRFAFDFTLEPGFRSLEKQTAIALMKLLLEGRWMLCPVFLQFLEQSKLRVINKDQWFNVYEFSRNILPDLSNYDEDGAWPVLLDEFVEWHQLQTKAVDGSDPTPSDLGS